MCPSNPAHCRKPESGSSRPRSEERIEDTLQMFRIDTNPDGKTATLHFFGGPVGPYTVRFHVVDNHNQASSVATFTFSAQ